MRTALGPAVLLLLVGCGGGHGAAATFRVGAFEPSVRVAQSLPGRPVVVHPTGGVIAASVRELLESGNRHARLPLYVGRTPDDRLCVGTTGIWNCLHPIDAQPVFAFTLQGGHRNIRDWGAVVGLAAPDVRVTVDHGNNREITLPLRRFPRFGWAAFASPMWMNGAPDVLHFYDRAGEELSGFLDLAGFANPCRRRSRDCTPKSEWHSIADTIDAAPLDERVRRTRELLSGVTRDAARRQRRHE